MFFGNFYEYTITDQSTLIVNFFVKTKDWGGGGGGGGLIERGGYKLSSSEKGGFIRERGGLFERGD